LLICDDNDVAVYFVFCNKHFSMRIFTLSFLLLIQSLFLTGQNFGNMSPVLYQKMQQLQPNETIEVDVYFEDQFNFAPFQQFGIINNWTATERIAQLNKQLKQKAEFSQAVINDLVELYRNQFSDNSAVVANYYIINAMVIKASPQLLETLSQMPEIAQLEWHFRYTLKYNGIVAKEASNQRAVEGHEPGLEAIKAPFMWNLGYTGLGTKLYTVDTGVWTVHPAISRQWRGNFLPEMHNWKPFDSSIPADKSDAHGTHVTGIVLGLDTATNDTIGVAFNASYMACDPIVEDAADIKPLFNILGAFEFALNPDGNVNTSEDVPDVICNSWGIGDSVVLNLCTASFVEGLYQSLDAAGIAVEFSAGNEGPGLGTVSLPQFVTLDSLTIFTVGALDANTPANTIADFSSRGPTPCDVTADLKIKPEVSAPGVNIRSSVQHDLYALYSGTSMAGPHVAGAVLLLKEAFPYLNGRDILNALYQSATDLGAVGEDNTYGNGIINLEAAFNFLALNNVPVPPNTSPFDIAVESIIAPIYSCGAPISSKAVLVNYGTTPIGGATLLLNLNLNNVGTITWNGLLNAGERDTIDLPVFNSVSGRNELIVAVEPLANIIEKNTLNNSRAFHFNTLVEKQIPYIETFEQMSLPSAEWLQLNPDNKKTWDTTHTKGIPYSGYSARMNFLSYSGSFREQDELVMPNINLNGATSNVFFGFQHAYRYRSVSLTDTVEVLVSNNCGETWQRIFYKGGQELNTVDTLWTNFRPFKATHWFDNIIGLDAFINSSEKLQFRIRSINDGASNFYMDNVRVFTGVDPAGIADIAKQPEWKLFPNPTAADFTLELAEVTTGNIDLEIIDLSGRVLQRQVFSGSKSTVNVSQLNSGTYFVRIIGNGFSSVKRLVKI